MVVALPDPSVALSPTAAYVELPTDGSAPKFVPLRDAINKVLAQDPGGGATLANRGPLSVSQSRQVAREIIWNRQISPAPDRPNGRRLEDMYTRPETPGGWSSDDRDKADMDRKQFEASLLGYYALQNANSERLTQYVFATSAAVWAEQQSGKPTRAGLRFPVETGLPPTPGATFRQADVVLENAGPLTLNFKVPAEYFYALSAVLASNITAEERYRMATDDEESRLVSSIKAAIDAGSIVAAATSPENAARRLTALGRGRVLRPALCPLNADVNTLVAAWLAHMAPSIDTFWQQNPFPNPLVAGHLDLVLAVVTQQTVVTPSSTALLTAIAAIPVTTVGQLKAITVQQWYAFFLPANVSLLPEFTKPGTPEERVEAFVRQVRKFFEVLSLAPTPAAGATPNALSIPIADGDPIGSFLAAFPGFAFPVANWADPSIASALQAVFPGDANAQTWLLDGLLTIDELLLATTGVGPADLQFSLIEALYARGFTSRAQIQALTPEEFQHALTGTIAYPWAAAIQAAAGGSTAVPDPAAPGPFVPINPDGSLINCIPPWHLSPLGPVKYLQDLLETGIGATCDAPAATGATLAALINPRRGALGNLHATAANVHTTLPLIDIVNENLEDLADNGAPGVVYDTNGTVLAGHALQQADDDGAEGHAPDTLFAALPEHSSPATPVKKPGAYAKLADDFTSPLLPYSQPLDVSRSYLCALGTSRFATMRTFREDITEFALEASREAADFQAHQWRYPVRIEIALEYLRLSPAEYQELYVQQISAVRLREMYGFLSDTVNGVDWKSVVVHVPEFLKRTGLDYCEFLELWESKFVEFENAPTKTARARRGRGEESKAFPKCEPCCPEDLVIQFINPSSAEDALRRLLVFVRLWRTMRCLPGARYSFADLRDICFVLGLFQGANINPGFIRQFAALQILRDDWGLDLGVDPTAAAGATGADRARLLGLWAGASHAAFGWGVDHLLARLEDRAEREHAQGRLPGSRHRHRPPEFIKILRDNLDPLSAAERLRPGGHDVARRAGLHAALHGSPGEALRIGVHDRRDACTCSRSISTSMATTHSSSRTRTRHSTSRSTSPRRATRSTCGTCAAGCWTSGSPTRTSPR